MTTRCGMKKLATLGAAVVLVTGLAQKASAADFCISYYENVINPTALVGRGFKIPARGRCRAFLGFKELFGTADVTGSACTASDGSAVNFVLTKSTRQFGLASVLHLTVSLPLDQQIGTILEQYANGNFANDLFGSAGPCSSGVTIP
jgi:hypothetical protein